VPIRRCIGCGEMKSKKELIRIVRTSEGDICLDDTGRKNGRGAYVCKNIVCMEKVKKTRGLDRSFKFSVPADVYERLSEEIKKYDEQ